MSATDRAAPQARRENGQGAKSEYSERGGKETYSTIEKGRVTEACLALAASASVSDSL
jgi:hypothetical protein